MVVDSKYGTHGSFSSSRGPLDGFSLLDKLTLMIGVWRAMGYDMKACEKDM